MNGLLISPAAQKDLMDIKQYISDELDNPVAAIRIVTKVTKRIKDLVDFPNMGALLSSKIKFETGYRYIVCDNYIVFYRFEGDSIYIDRVLHGKRDYIRILFGSLENRTK